MSDYTENKTPNLIINTLEDPSKLSEITVGENEIVLVPDDTEEELAKKQDKLVAGTNITLVDDPLTQTTLISSTAQESFFRGRWANWSNVPSNSNLYPEDYHGNRTPTNNDYMVVSDASGYVPDLSNMPRVEFRNMRLKPDGVQGASICDVFYYPDGITEVITYNFACIGMETYPSVADGKVLVNWWYGKNWTIKANATVYYNESYYNSGDEIYHGGNRDTIKIYFLDSVNTYEGSWRFMYIGTWATDGKLGWIPEYQLENVLPIATNTEPGIAKLYTTTGSNTDGAIDQNGTTNAISSAVSTHNTDTTAHSNIRGTANGLATLDGNAKVPLAQMNDAVLGNVSYQGLWDAATNTPFLQDPSGGLPTGYNALGYIETNNAEYIDTLLNYDANCNEIEYDVKFTVGNVAGYKKLFGACDSSSYGNAVNSSGTIIKTSYNGYEVTTFASNYSSPVLTNVSDPSEYKIVLNRQDSNVKTYIGGILSNTGNFTGSLSTNTIYLGAIHTDSGATGNWAGKIYYFRVKKDGVLVGDFRPAQRTSDNQYGFYDLVTNTFFTNQGSGTFTGGGAIEIPKGHYYITSVAGTQFNIHFEVGDWIISNGVSWSKVDNTDAVSSVEGRTGNVTVINDNASTGATAYTWSADKLETEFGSLGTAAYTASTDYATAAQGAKADTALQPADVQEYTANEVETLWNSI